MSEKVKAGMVLLTRIGTGGIKYPFWVAAHHICAIDPGPNEVGCAIELAVDIHSVTEGAEEVLALMDKAIAKPIDPALFLAFMKGVQ
jgi:hypothetical protein